MMVRVSAVLAAAVLAAVAGWAAPSAAAADPVFTVHMAPPAAGGADSNTGLTPDQPVVSLVRVEQVLRWASPGTDVEVRIQQGVYELPPMQNWRFYVPGHTISFLPADYEYGEGIDGIAGRPVFRNKRNADGTYPDGYWLIARPGASPGSPLYEGGTSGLRFYYLQIERYSHGGIGINAGTTTDDQYDPPIVLKANNGLNGNTFLGMYFANIGNKWTGGHYGWGAIVLTNSSRNSVANNHFVNIENTAAWRGYIHGVYVTHFSSYNDVRANRFAYIGGNPVKTRDRSSLNTFEANSFTRTGDTAYYRDDICDRACAIANSLSRECAGYHNRFVNNTLVSGYEGGAVATWLLSPAGNTYAGGSPCALPPGENRLYTGGNTAP
jgi:hypothetical protein